MKSGKVCKKTHLLSAIIIPCLIFTGCIRKSVTGSAIKHQLNLIASTADKSKFLSMSKIELLKWAKDMNNSEFHKKNPESLTWVEKNFIFAEDDKNFARLQTIVDSLHNALIESRNFTNNYQPPKPTVVVIPENSFNAFVLGWFSRYPTEIYRIEPKEIIGLTEEELKAFEEKKKAEMEENTVLIDEELKGFSQAKVDKNGVLTVKDISLPTIEGIITDVKPVLIRQNEYLKQLKSTCRMDSIENKISFNSECSSSFNAKWLITKQTLPFIFIHSKTIIDKSEAETIAVLAHELGHYYQGHATDTPYAGFKTQVNSDKVTVSDAETWSNLFAKGYFYDDTIAWKNSYPEPITSMETLNKIATINSSLLVNLKFMGILPTDEMTNEEYLTYPIFFSELLKENFVKDSVFPDIPYIKLPDGSINMPVIKLLTLKCSKNKFEGCDTFNKSTDELFTNMDIQIVSNLSLSIVKFADKIALKKSVGADKCLELLDTPDICLSSLDTKKQINERINKVLETNVSELKTLGDYFRLLGQERKKIYESRDNAILFLKNSKIGWYTTEQEADDVSLELTAKLGIDPKIPAKLWVAESEQFESILKQRKIPLEKLGIPDEKGCAYLYDNNFEDPVTHEKKLVTLGYAEGYQDEHHYACYRAFNIFREMNAHIYSTNSNSSFSLDVEAWKKMQVEAAKLK